MDLYGNFYIDSDGHIKKSVPSSNISKFEDGVDKPISEYKYFDNLSELKDAVNKVNSNFKFDNKTFFKTYAVKTDVNGNFKSIKIYSDFIGNKNLGGLNWYVTGYDIDSLKIIEEHYFFGEKPLIESFIKANNLMFKISSYENMEPYLYSIKYDKGNPIDFKTYFSEQGFPVVNKFVNEIKRNLRFN